MTSRLSLKKREKLRRFGEFREIYIGGRRLSGPHLTMFFKPNQLTHNRLGLSVAKKRFKLSTCRHNIQRCLREVYRLNKMRFLPGYDLVISAHRFNEDKIRLEDIKKELLSLAQKAGLLKTE